MQTPLVPAHSAVLQSAVSMAVMGIARVGRVRPQTSGYPQMVRTHSVSAAGFDGRGQALCRSTRYSSGRFVTNPKPCQPLEPIEAAVYYPSE